MRVSGRTTAVALVMLLGVVLMILGYGRTPGTLLVAGLLVTGAGVLWGIIDLIAGATGGTPAPGRAPTCPEVLLLKVLPNRRRTQRQIAQRTGHVSDARRVLAAEVEHVGAGEDLVLHAAVELALHLLARHVRGRLDALDAQAQLVGVGGAA
jgi:hypothetical protein